VPWNNAFLVMVKSAKAAERVMGAWRGSLKDGSNWWSPGQPMAA
jgi:hypothetical protein